MQLLDAVTMSPIEGYTFDDCRPLVTDALDGVVTWQGHGIGSEVPRAAVCLHFRVHNARVYAFQFNA